MYITTSQLDIQPACINKQLLYRLSCAKGVRGVEVLVYLCIVANIFLTEIRPVPKCLSESQYMLSRV